MTLEKTKLHCTHCGLRYLLATPDPSGKTLGEWKTAREKWLQENLCRVCHGRLQFED